MNKKEQNSNNTQKPKLGISDVINRSSYLDRTWIINENGEISSTECDEETIHLINHNTENWTTLPKDISQKIVDVLNGL
jgi:hypothetical protein